MRRVCSVRRRLLVAKETKRLPIGLVCRVCSVCCVWPLNSEADRVSAWRPACVGCAACVRFIITGFRETIEVSASSTETESEAANQSTKGTFLHEANPLFTPIGLCLAGSTPNDRVGSLGDPDAMTLHDAMTQAMCLGICNECVTMGRFMQYECVNWAKSQLIAPY